MTIRLETSASTTAPSSSAGTSPRPLLKASSEPVTFIPPLWFYPRILLREKGLVGPEAVWTVRSQRLGPSPEETTVTLVKLSVIHEARPAKGSVVTLPYLEILRRFDRMEGRSSIRYLT